MKNKLFNLMSISMLILFVSCKSPSKKKKTNTAGTTPPTCQEAHACDGGSTPADPFEPAEPFEPPTDFEFLAIHSFPEAGGFAFHVDDTIIVEFSKPLDESAFKDPDKFSGTILDVVQLQDPNGTLVQVRVTASASRLMITPKYSLTPSTTYELSISSELTAQDGSTMTAPFYVLFESDIPEGINPGTEILFSWDRLPNPDGNGGSYYYEEEGYNDYNLFYDLDSFPKNIGEWNRNYRHKLSFSDSDRGFSTDYDLQRYYYNVGLNLIKDRTYYFALDICKVAYCSEKSEEIGILIE